MIFTVKEGINKAEQMMKDVLELTKMQVLVGVPEEKDPRETGEDVGNAALAYIHDKGSPLAGIPARPFMDPGIKNAQEIINAEFMKLARKQLEDKDEDTIKKGFTRIGLIAQNSIKKIFNTSEGFAPLKRATLLGRLRKRKAAKKWTDERREEVMISLKPLVDTGNLRNAISFVVEEKE
jgi:hypothetical protein